MWARLLYFLLPSRWKNKHCLILFKVLPEKCGKDQHLSTKFKVLTKISSPIIDWARYMTHIEQCVCQWAAFFLSTVHMFRYRILCNLTFQTELPLYQFGQIGPYTPSFDASRASWPIEDRRHASLSITAEASSVYYAPPPLLPGQQLPCLMEWSAVQYLQLHCRGPFHLSTIFLSAALHKGVCAFRGPPVHHSQKAHRTEIVDHSGNGKARN